MASDDLVVTTNHELQFREWGRKVVLQKKVEALQDPELREIFKLLLQRIDVLDRHTWEKI